MEMLITQALDERDLLAKKIKTAINSQEFISMRKKDAAVDYNNAPVEKITEDIKSTYQSITDMIKRYCMIIQKIAESNATTLIEVSGQKMSISAAIAILKDIKNGTYFESKLLSKLTQDFESITSAVKRNNNTVDQNKLKLLEAILAKDNSKKPTTEDTDLVDRVNDKNYVELIDPLGITDLIADLRTRTSELQSNILTAIKISNATTIINID